jgi:hypothetical protein
MDKHPNKAKIQITDLINESVNNAVARRQQALELEGFGIDLSDGENQDYSQIKGGTLICSIPIKIVGVLTIPSDPSDRYQ